MMIKKGAWYEFRYNECDTDYIDNLINYFDIESKTIFEFFDIDELSKNLIITIYDYIDKYSNYRNNISSTSVGNMDFDDDNSYRYKCYKELVPVDIVEVRYSDYCEYYEVKNKTK